MTIEMTVVERDDEKLFDTGDLSLSRLPALPEFEGGTLRVKREGVAISETSGIQMYGTHGACTCFCGLEGIFNENDFQAWATASLSAEDFQTGDQLELEVDPALEQHFSQFLQSVYRFHQALTDSLTPGERITIEELDKRVEQSLQERSGDPNPQVLRF